MPLARLPRMTRQTRAADNNCCPNVNRGWLASWLAGWLCGSTSRLQGKKEEPVAVDPEGTVVIVAGDAVPGVTLSCLKAADSEAKDDSVELRVADGESGRRFTVEVFAVSFGKPGGVCVCEA